MTRTSAWLALGALCCALPFLEGCAKGNPKKPGISLGAPRVAWSVKTHEQRFGFMAAKIHPRMHRMFTVYDDSYADSFTCQTCHGEDADQVDWRMPNPDLYPLPKGNPVEASAEYDPEMTEFMVSNITEDLRKNLNRGVGPDVEVSCHSCHPIEEP